MKKTKIQETEEPKVNQTTNAESDYAWEQESGETGFEGTRPEDLGIPFLALLQKGSPEVDEDHPDHGTRKIEGARSGMIINTLTREIVYDKNEENPVKVIPLYHEKLFQEWKPRDQGGGFVTSHRTPIILTRCKRNDKNKDVLSDGHEIITTSYFSVLLLVQGQTDPTNEDESLRPSRALIAFSSTQLKKARMWLNLARSIKIGGRTPPLYSHIYNLTTTAESNEKGSWQGWVIAIDRVLTMADTGIIKESKTALSDMVSTKMLTPGDSQATAASSNTEEADDMPPDTDERAEAGMRRGR